MPVPDILATIGVVRDDVELAQKALRLALDAPDKEVSAVFHAKTRVALRAAIANAQAVLKVLE